MSAESHATLDAWLKRNEGNPETRGIEIKQPPLARPKLGTVRTFPYGEITVKPSNGRKREESTASIIDYQDVRLLLYHTDPEALGTICGQFTALFTNQPLPDLDKHMRTEGFTPFIEATKEKVEGNDVHRATLLWTVWRHIEK